jgi:hypothetical protein
MIAASDRLVPDLASIVPWFFSRLKIYVAVALVAAVAFLIGSGLYSFLWSTEISTVAPAALPASHSTPTAPVPVPATSVRR